MNKNSAPTPHYPEVPDNELPSLENLTLNEQQSSITETQDYSIKNSVVKQFKKKKIGKNRRYQFKDSGKARNNNRKKINYLEKKVKDLERELATLKRKFDCCPNCHFNLHENEYEREMMMRQQEYLNMVAGSFDSKRNSKESLEFEKIDFATALTSNPQMEEKSWIFVGALMIVLGSKVMDVDGTLNIFKIVNQAVDQVRRQVQKSQPKISIDFYHYKEDIQQDRNSIGFDPFYSKPQRGSFELQGVRIQSVQEYELFYDRKINFSVNYQALITVMEYLKDNCSFS